jgi:hypothetical protein
MTEGAMTDRTAAPHELLVVANLGKRFGGFVA